MATIASIDVRLSAQIADFNRKMHSASQTVRKFQRTAENTSAKFKATFSDDATSASRFGAVLKSSAGIAAAGFATLAIAAERASRAYEKHMQQEHRLQGVLKATGGAAGFTGRQLSEMAQSLERTTGIMDEEILGVMSILATYRSVTGATFEEAVGLTLDLAKAMGTDFKSAAKQLGKALEEPTRGSAALRDAGVSLSQQQIEQIRIFEQSGHKLKAQAMILAELQNEVGGVAAASATATEKMAAAWKSLMVEIGEHAKPVENAKGNLTSLIIWLTDEIDNLTQTEEHWKQVGRERWEQMLAETKAINDQAAALQKLANMPPPKMDTGPSDAFLAMELNDKAFGELTDMIAGLTSEYEGLFGIEQKLARLEGEGLPMALINRARQIQANIDAVTKQRDEEQRLADQAKATEDQMRQMAENIFEQTRTPLEKYTKELSDLKTLLDVGAIDFDTAERAGKAAFEQLQASLKVDRKAQDLSGTGADVAGSREAFATIAAFRRRGAEAGMNDVDAKQLETQKQIHEGIKQLIALFGAQVQIVVEGV